MKIGFIGLGIMGKPMSKNLIAAGHELLVSDLNQDAVAEVVSAGATASCIYTQKGNKKIRKPQAANQTALIFDRRAAARLLSINSIRRLCWS